MGSRRKVKGHMRVLIKELLQQYKYCIKSLHKINHYSTLQHFSNSTRTDYKYQETHPKRTDV